MLFRRINDERCDTDGGEDVVDVAIDVGIVRSPVATSIQLEQLVQRTVFGRRLAATHKPWRDSKFCMSTMPPGAMVCLAPKSRGGSLAGPLKQIARSEN